jgi:hypothetical protein
MDAFQAIVRLILDKASISQLQSQIKSANLTAHVGVSGVDQLNLDKRISMLANQMLTFRNNNTKMNKAMTGELNQMYNKLINGANLSQKEVAELSAQFARLKLQVRDAGMLGHSMGNKFKNAWAKFSQWGVATGLLMRGINGIRNMIVGVKDLDTALVDLRKTTTMSASQLENFYYTANETAKQMGVTTNEIISQAAAWSRLGLTK